MSTDNFCKFTRSKDGFKAWCKPCSKHYMKQYRSTKPEYRERESKYQKERAQLSNEERILANLTNAVQKCRINNINIPQNVFNESALETTSYYVTTESTQNQDA